MNKFTIHLISFILMIVTLQLGYWLLGNDTMTTILTLIGSLAFGMGWKYITDYLIDQK